MLKFNPPEFPNYTFRSDGKVTRQFKDGVREVKQTGGSFRLTNNANERVRISLRAVVGLVNRFHGRFDSRKTLPEPYDAYEMDTVCNIYNKENPLDALKHMDFRLKLENNNFDLLYVYCVLFHKSSGTNKLLINFDRWAHDFDYHNTNGKVKLTPSKRIMRLVHPNMPVDGIIVGDNPDYIYSKSKLYHYNYMDIIEPFEVTKTTVKFNLPMTINVAGSTTSTMKIVEFKI